MRKILLSIFKSLHYTIDLKIITYDKQLPARSELLAVLMSITKRLAHYFVCVIPVKKFCPVQNRNSICLKPL